MTYRSIARALFKAPWSALVCLLFAWAAAQEIQRIHFWSDLRTLNWDIEAYYHYLPATFIHHDVRDLSYVVRVDPTLHPDLQQSAFGIVADSTTGHDHLKYTCGVALFELPLFLLARALSDPASPPAIDGYSAPYQLAVSLSTVLFVLLGLLVLRRFLLRHVSDRAAAIAIIILAFGTNLFFYSTVDSGMSHGYLFFLFALVLERTDRWHRAPRTRTAIGLGLALGMVALTRPVDVLVVLVPITWTTGEGWRAKWAVVRAHQRQLLIGALCGAIPIVPQLLYWKATTGSFIFYSYGNEGFNWSDPHIIDGLFSFRKGWFIWSPLVAFGVAGLVMMLRDRVWRPFAMPVLAFFAPALYVIFCWYQWWYGGGFGARPLVETLALLALPLAVLAERVLRSRLFVSIPFMLIVVAGIHLNLFQQRQYLQAIIRWDGMTRERYWEVFGAENWDGLRPFP